MHELISPYVDGELDLVNGTEVERHLDDCEICAREYKGYVALRAGLRGPDLYFNPAKRLEDRVRSSIRAAHKQETGARRFSFWWATAAAALAILLIVGIFSIRWMNRSAANERMAQQVIASHIRSLMPNHLTDVVSTDQHTVKPWFNGKLDFSPPVKDLASEGFPLVGGRLDYLEDRPVASVVYQRRQHYINLFLWPLESGSDGEKQFTRQGYNVIHWDYEGMDCWAVSDLNPAELRQFVALLK
jgi:anti-sigma factor RsiW